MAVECKAIFCSKDHNASSAAVANSFGAGFIQVTGVTPGFPLVIKRAVGSTGAVGITAGFGFGDADGNALISFLGNVIYQNSSFGFALDLVTTTGASVATFSRGPTEIGLNNFASPFEHTNAGLWTFTQDAAKNVTAQITDYQSVTSYTIFESFDSGPLATQELFKIWEIKMLGPDGSLLQTNSLTPRPDGQQPFTVFPSSVVTATGEYFFNVSRKVRLVQSATTAIAFDGTFTTILTAPAVTSGTTASMFTWLNNDYWYVTDLQLNLGTRAVTHRHGTVQIKPQDTVNFAVLFHDGSAGVNPVATDLKLAVRAPGNSSPYFFYANPAVTTTSVSGDVFYTITVTAADEDLLSSQAAVLLAGSNAAANLTAEIQWTTTRGTFSSDTFTIELANEVEREPDV